MTFKEKIKHIMEIKGINNKDLALKIGVNDSLISKWINKGEASLGFINHLVKIYPDIDLNYLMKDETTNVVYKPLFEENIIEEERIHYPTAKTNKQLVEEIEHNLSQLKKNLAQNSHTKQ